MAASTKDLSAQQAPYEPVRLLIAEQSENSAHELDSLLRDAGIATRLEIIELPMAVDKLASADLLLCNAELPELEKILPRLAGIAPHVPILIVNRGTGAPEDGGNDGTDTKSVMSSADGLALGAADVVSLADTRHLVLVVQRELAHVCRNVQLRQTRKALREAEKRCELLLASSRAAIAYVHEGMHIHANEHYLELFGFDDQEDLLGLPLMDLMTAESAELLKQNLKAFRDGGQEIAFDIVGRHAAGGEVPGTMTLAAAEYEGEPCLQIIIRAPTSAQTLTLVPELDTGSAPAVSSGEAEQSGDGPSSGHTDSGSDLPAEVVASKDAHDELSMSAFLGAARQLALENADGFVAVFAAQINRLDELQKAFGLTGVAEACRQVEAHLVSVVNAPMVRIAPSQWGMLVCASTREEALATVNDYRKAVEGMMFEVREKTLRPTCSFAGAILNPEEFPSLDDALEATLDSAFVNLADAIEEGELNTVRLPAFGTEEQAQDNEAARILGIISDAIESQAFTLLFQPIISLRGDSDEHYEVFLRMSDRDGNQMAPAQFLRTAIDAGVAGKIDRWVILQAIKMLSAHRGNGHNTRLTINLTANSVTDPEFLQWLSVAIKAARLPSDAVIFQITEVDAAAHIRQSREFVEGLANLHCRTSLSRFGLESDPFEVLSHIPVDFVKLDGSLIEALVDDPGMKSAITNMVRDLQNAGKLTIVPMVESASLLSTLWQAGVNYIQGHYLQAPSTDMDYDFSTDD